MKNSRSVPFVWVTLLLCIPRWGAAQGAIEGYVRTRAGDPIAEAYVEVLRGVRQVFATASTDLNGFFRVRVQPGGYVLRASRLGFADTTQAVQVIADETRRVALVLDDRPVEVEGLIVAGQRGRRAFEETAGQTTRELSRGELKQIPGLAESDVLRAVEVLPGVVSTSDFSSAFNVRGGSADQNLITMDGFPIFNPFHLGGLFSVFNTDMVERAELIAGGFPAQYGGRVSSVLNVESDPGTSGTNFNAGVSLLATRIAAGADLPEGATERIGLRSARGRLSLRRSYFDQLFRPFFDFPYHLTDVQAYAEGWTRGGGRISFTGYTGRDVVDFTGVESFPLKIRWDWGNDVAGLRWLQHSGAGGSLDARVGYTRFNTGIAFPEFSDTRFRSRIEQAFARTDLQWAAHRDLELRGGVEADRVVYANRAASGGTVFREGRDRSWLLGGYLQANWRPGSSWLVELGARADAWLNDRQAFVAQPRLALKRFMGPNTAIKLAAGRYGQFLHSVRDEELPVGIDIWVTTGARAPHVISDQVQTGLEFFRGDWYFTLDGYYRTFAGVITNNLADDPNTPLDDLMAGDGTSYGGDLLVRKDAGLVRGFVSVSWLKAERTFPDPTTGIDPPPVVAYAPIFDRRLDLDLVLRTTLPRQWELGARLNFGTGLPYTRPLGSFLYYEYHIVQRGRRLISDRPDSARSAILLGDRNAERYPAYHRLDLNLRKTVQTSWGRVTPYLDVLNVLNRKNVLFYFYEYDRDPPIRSGVSMFPLLPTIGLDVVF